MKKNSAKKKIQKILRIRQKMRKVSIGRSYYTMFEPILKIQLLINMTTSNSLHRLLSAPERRLQQARWLVLGTAQLCWGKASLAKRPGPAAFVVICDGYSGLLRLWRITASHQPFLSLKEQLPMSSAVPAFAP